MSIYKAEKIGLELLKTSKNIDGTEEFVKQKMALYEEDEKIRLMAKNIQLQEKIITENFFNK